MRSQTAVEWCSDNLVSVGDTIEVFIGERYAPVTLGWVPMIVKYIGTRAIVAMHGSTETLLTGGRGKRLPLG